MKRSILIIFPLLFFLVVVHAQQDANNIFIRQKGTFKYPVEKVTAIENHDERNREEQHGGPPNVLFFSDSCAAVNAVFNGTVVLVDAYDDVYLVIIKYGDYFMCYINLSKVLIEKGTLVKTGQKIGVVGKDLDNRYCVEIGLNNRQQDLDPMPWFCKDIAD